MILVGVVEIKDEKLYWGKDPERWIVSDLRDTCKGHVLTTNRKEHGLHESIKLFLEEMPFAERAVWYIRTIERAIERGWPAIADEYEKLLNENYNIYTFSGESV
jgi:hypothetical protein